MNVVCCGMKRSASTWLFNVVRLMLESEGPTISGFEDRPLRRGGGVGNLVVKAHKYNRHLGYLGAPVLGTVRDLRDLFASAYVRHEGGIQECDPMTAVRFLMQQVDHQWAWKDAGAAFFRYEDIVRNPVAIAREIDNLVVPRGKNRANPQEIVDQVERLGAPDVGCDPETLIWHDHVTGVGVGGFSDVLEPSTVEAIEATFCDWMVRWQYLR